MLEMEVEVRRRFEGTRRGLMNEEKVSVMRVMEVNGDEVRVRGGIQW